MKSAVFSASYNLDDTYDAYERDIALVSFYFEQSTVFEYARLERGVVTYMWKLPKSSLFQRGQDDTSQLHFTSTHQITLNSIHFERMIFRSAAS